jgi:hypothetical protein
MVSHDFETFGRQQPHNGDIFFSLQLSTSAKSANKTIFNHDKAGIFASYLNSHHFRDK